MGILILAVSLAIVSTGVQSYCSKYDIEQCMKPIKDLRTRLGISDKLAYFPIYSLNDEQLDEYCRVGTRVTECQNGLYGCTKAQQLTFEGLHNAFVYLCKETLKEYKTHQKCYAEKAVIDGLHRCNSEAKKSFSTMDVHSFDAKDTYCGYVKDHYSCIRNTVQPECGKQAADWEVTYAKKIIQPVLDLVKCIDTDGSDQSGGSNQRDTDGSDQSGGSNQRDYGSGGSDQSGGSDKRGIPIWVIGTIASGIFCIIVVCAAVCLSVRRFRKRNGENAASNHFNNVLANQKA